MPIGKQGGHVKAMVKPNHISKKPGGGSGPAGGKTVTGMTPSPKPGNKSNIKTSR